MPMAAAGLSSVLFALVLLPHGSTGVSLHSEKESERLVRRESKEEPSRKVEVSPRGEVLHQEKHVDPHAHNHVKHHENHHELHALMKDNTKLTEEANADLGVQFCDYDFTLGKPGTDECFNNNSIMLEESMCIDAGNRSGAGTAHSGFLIPQDDSQKHPKGCFKDVCKSDNKSACYFYNPRELKAHANATLTGTIVCSRDTYLKGKNDTNDACPAGYKIIANEKHCMSTANCLGMAPAPDFRIGTKNESQQLDFPQACFIDDDGLVGEGKGQVYYNPGSNMTSKGWGKHVKGTPLCQVAETVKWQADGTQAGNVTK